MDTAATTARAPGRAPGTTPRPPEPGAIPWLAVAERLMAAGPEGLRGERALLHWIGRMNRGAPWTVPWCGLFVAHCLRAALPGIEIPAVPMRARPWRRWGAPVRPQRGALMLFWHYHPGLPFGHVAFYWAEDRDAYHVLGGNQDHRVCIQRYPKVRFVTARWPEGAPRPGIRRIERPVGTRPFP